MTFLYLISLYCYAHNEGFWLDTLIHCTFGLHPIQTCTASDTVIGRNHDNKNILASTKLFVDRYVRLTFSDGFVHVGCEQLLRIDRDTWVCAQDLHEGDALLDTAGSHHLVRSVEIIHEDAVLYALSVQDYILAIEPYGLLVHNMAVTLGVSTLSLGAISITNPITIAIGATVALSIVASRAWQAWQNQSALSTTTLPDDVALTERSYYESRKKELDLLIDELTRIKKTIETIKLLCNTASFTYQFFKQTSPPSKSTKPHPWLTITRDKELKLSETQQQELRALRQQDLLMHEQKIIELHTMLAMHSNALIEHVGANCAEYQTCSASLHDTFKDFQCGHLSNKEIAHVYSCLLNQELMLNRILCTVQEACCIGEYYHKLPATSCIHSSTTIVQAWHQIQSCIASKKQWIIKERDTCNQRMRVVEQYFTRRGGDINKLKHNLRDIVEKRLNTRDIAVMTAAANKLASATQEATASVTLPQEELEQKEKNNIKTVKDILANATFIEEKQLSKLFSKGGGYQEALQDFESLGPTQVKDISKDGKKGLRGILPDGSRVNVREKSTDQRPTLEIQPPENVDGKFIKIRYGTK